jgi:hypothetical protein
VYTAPSGDSITFDYDGAISDTVKHSISTFNFADVNGSYTQDRSIDSGEYTFNVFLTGDDRVERLIYVRSLLNELGTDDSYGQLEHPDPSIGTFNCVVSNYSVSHNVVKNINIIMISITFLRTILNLQDGGIDFSAQDIYSKSLSIFEQFSQDFKSAIDVKNGNAISALISDTVNTVNEITSVFSSVTTAIDELSIAFSDSAAEILSSIDSLARAPETLAASMQNLLTLPVIFSDDLISRVNSFGKIIDKALTFTEEKNKEISEGSIVGKVYLANAVMIANASLTGLLQVYSIAKSTNLEEIKSGRSTGFSSRQQIMHAIKNILESVESISVVMSEKAKGFSNINFFKQYFDYTLVVKPIVKSTVVNLQNRLSLLPIGRGAVLPYDESPVVLCSLIYNTVDLEVLQFFYDSNNIHGDEMYLLKKGRSIIWYGDSIFDSNLDEVIPTIVEPEIDVWQDTPWDSGNEQIQDQPWLTDNENVQDIPVGE